MSLFTSVETIHQVKSTKSLDTQARLIYLLGFSGDTYYTPDYTFKTKDLAFSR